MTCSQQQHYSTHCCNSPFKIYFSAVAAPQPCRAAERQLKARADMNPHWFQQEPWQEKAMARFKNGSATSQVPAQLCHCNTRITQLIIDTGGIEMGFGPLLNINLGNKGAFCLWPNAVHAAWADLGSIQDMTLRNRCRWVYFSFHEWVLYICKTDEKNPDFYCRSTGLFGKGHFVNCSQQIPGVKTRSGVSIQHPPETPVLMKY